MEAKKMLFSLWASAPGVRLDFADAARASFYARARRRARVELSNEDFAEGNFGLLEKASRGARDAAQNLELE